MRTLLAGIAMLALSVALLTSAQAGGDKGKEVTLKGKVTCAKCDLGTETKCATVIVTKIDGKDATVYFDAASHKKFHGDTCNDPKMGSVTGVLSTKGEKKIIAAKTVKYD
jgi:hypothetical protein